MQASDSNAEYSLVVTTTDSNLPSSSSLKTQHKEELLEMEKKSIVLVKIILALQEKLINTLFPPQEIIEVPNWLVYLQWKDGEQWRENVVSVLNTCFGGVGKWNELTQEIKDDQVIKSIQKSISYSAELQELQDKMKNMEEQLKSMQ